MKQRVQYVGGDNRVDGRLEEVREDAPGRLVHLHEIPAGRDHQGGIGLLLREDELEDSAQGAHLLGVEARFPVYRSIAGSTEQHVSLAQRQV